MWRVVGGVRVRQAVGVVGLAALLGASAAALLLVRPGLPVRAQTPAPGSVTVTGHGDVRVTDVVATWTVGVEHQAATAEAALQAVDGPVSRILAALRAAGLPSEDLQTGELSLQPVYQESSGGQGPGVLVGFDAQEEIDVTVPASDLARVGSMVDAVVAAGATTVGGLAFAPADPSAAEASALRAAYADARLRAETLAQAAGVSLGPVTSMSTETQGPPVVFASYAMPSAASGGTVVLPGAVHVSADVTVTFATVPR